MPDAGTEDSFKDYFSKIVNKHKISPNLWLAHDEFNEFYLGVSNKVTIEWQYDSVVDMMVVDVMVAVLHCRRQYW